MKVSREQAAQNRDRVLEVAGRLFRERGFDGIGVADLMKGAGLTHGGFYGQFASKEELMAQACARAFAASADIGAAVARRYPDAPLAAISRGYLSKQHRDHPGEGCVMATLGADAARQGPSLRRAVTEGTRRLLDLFTELAPGRLKARKRERAVLAYASMVGGLVLARAVDDEALSNEILKTVAAALPVAGTS